LGINTNDIKSLFAIDFFRRKRIIIFKQNNHIEDYCMHLLQLFKKNHNLKKNLKTTSNEKLLRAAS